jgi:threonine dehydrogenase-like Zn-dependent dehydrogenase
MRQVLARGGTVRVEEVPAPVASGNTLLVRAVCSLISPGTEAMQIAASRSHPAPQPLGYSLVGYVEDRGPAAPSIDPGTLVACAGGEYAPHAEWAAVPPLMATPVPGGVDARAAAFATLGTIAMHALRQGEVVLGSRVVVVGLGVVGQLLAQLVRVAGAQVLGIDLVQARASLASRLAGAHVVDAEGATLVDDVMRWTGGIGADSVFLCTAGGEGVVDGAARLARDRGHLVVVGTPALEYARDTIFAKELDVRIARATGPGRYDPVYERQGVDYPVGYVRWTQARNRAEFLRLLADGLVRVDPLITHTFDVGDAPVAYDALRDRPESTMGVVLTYGATASAARGT